MACFVKPESRRFKNLFGLRPSRSMSQGHGRAIDLLAQLT